MRKFVAYLAGCSTRLLGVMPKRFAIIALAITFVATITYAVLVPAGDYFVVKGKHGELLPVPKAYVAHFGPLVRAYVPDRSATYDSGEGSVALSIPESVFSQHISALPLSGRDYGFILYLPEPGVDVSEIVRSRIGDMIHKRGKWTDPRWHVIGSAGLIGVHNGDFVEMYDVLRIEPHPEVVSFSSDDWIAGCVEGPNVGESRCLMQFTAAGINVEIWISDQVLPFRDDIRRVVGDEISAWRTEYARNDA
jgi:hypothetical protein